MRKFPPLALAIVLGGCVYLPKTTTVYDEKCDVHARQMALQPAQLGYFHGGCSGRDCAYALAALGAVAAASVVVSGTIVVAGNVVYWFEKQGHCVAKAVG